MRVYLAVVLVSLTLLACKKDSAVKLGGAARPKSAQAKDFTVDLGSSVTLEMVWIPGGTFEMGSNDGDSNERPVHTVKLDGFWMGKYEVTQAQWEAVMGGNPSTCKGASNPVESVSWNDATEFCRKLSTKTSQTFTLPSEAQWENACRAGSTTEYCYGDDETALADHAWFGANSDGEPHPVGQKKPNAWGLYDMHGNVFEWCADWYAGYPDGSLTDPTGPASGRYRVVRGGGWYRSAQNCRSAARYGFTPGFRYVSLDVGFRLSRTP